MRLSEQSSWLIIYDHVLAVTVSEGDYISQGIPLGKVGIGNRTEIQLNKQTNGTDLAYCPLNYATSSFIETHTTFLPNWCLEKTIIF